MKSNFTSIMLSGAAVAAMLLLAGCAKEDGLNPVDKSCAELELTDVNSGEMLSKAAIDGTGFPRDGRIGLFFFKDEAGAELYGDGACSNVEYSYNQDKSKWTANPAIRVGSTPGYLYGYYPYNGANKDVKAIAVESSLDGDDAMYVAKQDPVTDQTAGNVAITMRHALARVSITVKNKGYSGAAKLSRIEFVGAKTAPSGTLNALDGSINATKSDVTLEVPEANQQITEAGTRYECLLVPSEVDTKAQNVTLRLTIDGQQKTVSLTGENAMKIVSGVKARLTIDISDTGLSVVGGIHIDDWQTVTVGGHTVTVKFDEGVNVIEEDVLVTAYAKNGNAVIEAFSKSGKQITCQLDDDSMVNPEATDNISKFVIPVGSKDIVATIGVWGEGGRREITIGGHKVTVKYDEGVNVIEEDVWVTAYAKNGNAVIEAFSKSGKQITCQLNDDSMVNPEITDNISKFVIPVESKDIVATIGVWGEGGRNQITVGEHKVTVELANGVNESDVWFNAYVNSDGKAAVSVQSSNGKKLSFRRDYTGTILGIAPQDNIYDIVLSEVNQDITVTIDYFLNSNPEFTTISGHKVSVVLDADTDILKGISIDNNGKLVIEAESCSYGNPVKCVKDGERIAGSKTGTLYKFIISDITGDATITIGYSKYTATIGFAQVSVTDKATLKINGDEVEAGGSTSVFEGTDVEYSAVTDDGYLVFGWYDNDGKKVSDAESFTVSNINSDVAFYAEVKAGCRLTVNTISAGTSTIAANGVSIESGRAYSYDPNTQITLTASPATGCQFVEWCDADGKTLSIENSYSFTLSDNLTITAVFVPQDALSGVFSVSGNKKVRFSKGNLYYDGNQSEYFFESNQYSTPSIGNETSNYIGHFYWSKDTTVARSLSNYTDSGASDTDVFFTNDSENQAKPNIKFTVNGQTGFWRVLSGGDNGEWSYLLNSRNTAYGSNRRYAAVKVNGMAGLLIFPDDFSSWPSGAGDEPQTFNTNSSNWNGKDYTVAEFTVLQNNGCVFLPAAGYRDGNPGNQDPPAYVYNVGDYGYYWSASPSGNLDAYGLHFNSGYVNPNHRGSRRRAYSVRLVTESK